MSYSSYENRKTYEISRDQLEGLECVAEGYKAIKWDYKTLRYSSGFAYNMSGDNLVGKVFKVDGPIEICEWGLHFCKDPANVFAFYEPVSYNHYYKVKAYNTVLDDENGLKSVTDILEFVEEYTAREYTDIVESFDRGVNYSQDDIDNDNTSVNVSNSFAVNLSVNVNDSSAIYHSTITRESVACNSSNIVNSSSAINYASQVTASSSVNHSRNISGSNAVNYSSVIKDSNTVCASDYVNESNSIDTSDYVNKSRNVLRSTGVTESQVIGYSFGIVDSFAIVGSCGIRHCSALRDCAFCCNISGRRNVIFNKRCSADRVFEILSKLRSFHWEPKFCNWKEVSPEDTKAENLSFCFPKLAEVSNEAAWSKMPLEMLEYIQSLPEYNDDIFKAVTGNTIVNLITKHERESV